MYARIVAGAVLIFIGLAFLAEALGFGLGVSLWRFWPLFVIGGGAAQLISRPSAWIGPVITILVGVVLLGASLGILGDNSWNLLWPVILILIGVGVMLNISEMRGGPRPQTATGPALPPSSTDAQVRGSAFVGGMDLRSAAPAFQRGDVSAFFGSYELDLSEASIASGGATIEASALFGTVSVVLPAGVRLELRGAPIFGSIADKRTHTSGVGVDAPPVVVRASAIFGSVDIDD